MTTHIGFTGTRYGMSTEQRATVDELVSELFGDVTAHHGMCVGADEEFHEICRVRGCRVIGHPGPDWPDGQWCAYTICGEVLDPLPHMKRNAAIVAASQIMIAAPLEDTERNRGGTWATYRMARKALDRGTLRTLYVAWRNGRLERRDAAL